MQEINPISRRCRLCPLAASPPPPPPLPPPLAATAQEKLSALPRLRCRKLEAHGSWSEDSSSKSRYGVRQSRCQASQNQSASQPDWPEAPPLLTKCAGCSGAAAAGALGDGSGGSCRACAVTGVAGCGGVPF